MRKTYGQVAYESYRKVTGIGPLTFNDLSDSEKLAWEAAGDSIDRYLAYGGTGAADDPEYQCLDNAIDRLEAATEIEKAVSEKYDRERAK